MTKYTPKWTDRRVRSRIRTALDAVAYKFRDGQVLKDWWSVDMDLVLGRSNKDIGRWTRSHLLTTSSQSYSSIEHYCIQYQVNTQGYQYVLESLTQAEADAVTFKRKHKSLTRDDVSGNSVSYLMGDSISTYNMTYVQWLKSQSDKEVIINYPLVFSMSALSRPASFTDKSYLIKASPLRHKYVRQLLAGDFEYTTQDCGRLGHPIQNLQSDMKRHLLAEYRIKYHYDVECCAATLLYQYSRTINPKMSLPQIESYLADRTKLREYLAQKLDISTANAKAIISALINGARIKVDAVVSLKRRKTGICMLLGADTNKIVALREDPVMGLFRKEITQMWKPIKGSNSKFGAKERAAVYFRLERQVLDAARTYLDSMSLRYLLEHDGWSTDEQINANDICDVIRTKTGFVVNLSQELYDEDTRELMSLVTDVRADSWSQEQMEVELS